jgi:hypothetical protein
LTAGHIPRGICRVAQTTLRVGAILLSLKLICSKVNTALAS